jgi:hypothetical protein
MKLDNIIPFGIGALLGGAAVALVVVLTLGTSRLSSRLENVTLLEIQLDKVTLVDVARAVESRLKRQGIHCVVIVDSSIAGRSLDRFSVGGGNGVFVFHGLAAAFGCDFQFCGNKIVLHAK